MEMEHEELEKLYAESFREDVVPGAIPVLDRQSLRVCAVPVVTYA